HPGRGRRTVHFRGRTGYGKQLSPPGPAAGKFFSRPGPVEGPPRFRLGVGLWPGGTPARGFGPARGGAHGQGGLHVLTVKPCSHGNPLPRTSVQLLPWFFR